MAKKLTTEEILKRKSEFFDVNKLLEPYKEGGTPEHPVERTLGTIVDYFINKKRYPIEVAGAGIFYTLLELKNGKVFRGNGNYGSKGVELVTYIRVLCDKINQEKLDAEIFKQIAQANLTEVSEYINNEIKVIESGLDRKIEYYSVPMPLRIFTPSRWRWRLRKKYESAQRS